MSVSCNTWRSGRFSTRTCILYSILLHVALLYIPLQQGNADSIPGRMSMVIAVGMGGGAQKTPAPKPAKPKSVAAPQAVEQPARKPAPVETQQPVEQPQVKPQPVKHQRQIAQAKLKPAPVVKKQPVAKPKTDPVPEKQQTVTVAPQAEPVKKTAPKVVKKKRIAKKQKQTKKAVASNTKQSATPAKQAADASEARNAAPEGAQKAVAAASGGREGKKDKAVDNGPIHAAIGSLYGPKVSRWRPPSYPRKAKDMRQTGVVVLRITIDANGRPAKVEVVQRAGSGFDEAAVAAVRNSMFTPATKDGRPVACIALLPVRFNLKGN